MLFEDISLTIPVVVTHGDTSVGNINSALTVGDCKLGPGFSKVKIIYI
jgi:hypothetical protein